MATITTNPESILKSAFDAVDQANQALEMQRTAQTAAQGKAEAAGAHEAVVKIELKNAEAKYSVLSESVESAAPDLTALRARQDARQRELNQTVAAIGQAVVDERAARRARSALGQIITAAEGWITDARDAAGALRESSDAVRTLPPGGATKARLANIAEDLSALHTLLIDRLTTLSLSHQTLRDSIGKVTVSTSTSASPSALRTKRDQLRQELAVIARELKAKQPAVDPRQLREAEAELLAAKQAADEAPKAVQTTQAEVQQAGESLAKTQELLQVAQDNLDEVEGQFVDRIEVSKPNAAGFATAQARLKQAIPPGYVLRWDAGGAPVEPPTGESVRIDARTLPVGRTTITVSLERQ